MKYEFDKIANRRGTNCVKWDAYPADRLPLWVADMDFDVCPKIIDAMRKRLEHPVFGYSKDYDELKQVIVDRMKRLYNWDITADSIIFVPGIVSGFNFAVRAYCGADSSVIYQTPAYPPFIAAPQNFDIEGINNDLYFDESDRLWKIDFEKFESQIKANTSLFMLCNPHNPVGRVFTKEELTKLGNICAKHNMYICSDEIHSDIIYSGHHQTPIASINEDFANRTITFIAPSKTYNIPGLSCSAAIIPNKDMRDKYAKALAGLCSGVTGIAQIAGIAAYRDCQDWLDELRVYLEGNRDFAEDYIRANMPAIKTNKMEGTFLMWLDCSACGIEGSPADFFAEKAHVQLNDGIAFGKDYGKFVRLNLGTNRATLTEALERMKNALEKGA